MSGITDAPFRRLAERLGAGLVVSEMTACAGLVRGEREARVRSEGSGVGIHVVQLAGCEARWMAEGARIAEAQGAAIIDINMGCPSKQVTNGAAGSALMRDVDHALTLIEATVSAVRVPVTLKMRLGWDASSINAPELARRAEGAGIKLITVHGRTRCQFYDGSADWSAVRAVKQAVSIPVVVNGDIRSSRGCPERACCLRRRRGDDRASRTGPSMAAGTDRAIFGDRNARTDSVAWRTVHDDRQPLPTRCLAITDTPSGAVTRASILGGRSTPLRRPFGRRSNRLKGHRSRVLTAEEPSQARRFLADAYDDFAWRAAA